MTRRLALVIGNAAYAHASELANPRNDATAIADALKELDFIVTLGIDLGRDQMEDVLIRFGGDIDKADAALFFFAGHGIQVEGQNYLIPVDAQIRERLHLQRRTYALTEILKMMEDRARNSLMFLDACRDNPFTRSYLSNLSDEQRARSLVRSGLAEMALKPNRSSFIAYATAPDTVAYDGTGLNSPFTLGLLQHIRTPNISISDMMIEVRNSVLEATNDRQRPWDQSSLRQRFFFNVPDTEAKPTHTEAKFTQTEAKQEHKLSDEGVLNAVALEHWSAIKGAADPRKLRDFLAEFGAAKVSLLARDRLNELEAAAWSRLPAKRTVDALHAFLADFPDGVNAQAATAELRAMLAASQRAEAKPLPRPPPRPSEQPEIPRSRSFNVWKQLQVEGITRLVLGALAIPISFVMFWTPIYIGWLFLISGVAGLITTLQLRHAPGFWWSLLSALLGIAAGLVLSSVAPVFGWDSAFNSFIIGGGRDHYTLLLIVFFSVEGVASIMYAFEHKRERSGRWNWLLTSGIIDLILAAIVLFEVPRLIGAPSYVIWPYGLLVSINMLFGGAAMVAMALHARSSKPTVAAEAPGSLR